MDYLRLEKLEDELIQIPSINEDEESDVESRRDLPNILKSEGIPSPKRRSTEEKISEIQAELSDLSHRFASGKKSTRLGFKIISGTDSEFPLLIRGLDSEKNKESNELMKKRSLKDSFYHQNSLEDDKFDVNSLRSESIPQNFEEVSEDEDIIALKTPSVLAEEIASFGSSVQGSPYEVRKSLNIGLMKSVLSENWHYKNKLYLAVNECGSEDLSLNLNKCVFYAKEKEENLIALSLDYLKNTEQAWIEASQRNLELKKLLEKLKNERKKACFEQDFTTGAIKTVLSSLHEEKLTVQMTSKNLDMLLNDEKTKKIELSQDLLTSYESYQKISERLRELEENWQMNINDLSINLYEISKKRENFQEKTKKNQGLVEELKFLAGLSVFQKEQIDFCLEMITKTMDFFAECKEHKSFNVFFR